MTPLLRPARAEDKAFVFSAWLHNQRDAHRWLPDGPYFRHYHDHIERLCSDGTVLVACNPDDDGQIYGFCVYAKDRTVRFAYVKQVFRKMGIGRALFAAAKGAE